MLPENAMSDYVDSNLINVTSIQKTSIGSRSVDTSLKKCVRKGDIICFSKSENINMLSSITKERNSNTKVSVEDTSNHPDRVMSGESLYKTFTFEQSSNKEETEKCIAFWKSVMEKNLAPIKCTIIENKRKQHQESIQEEPETIISGENATDEEKEIIRVSDTEEINKIHEEYRKLWMVVLKEIQKKKLDQLKLIGKAKCRLCDSIATPPIRDACDLDVTAQKKDVEELNNWKSVSKKKRFGPVTTESVVSTQSSDETVALPKQVDSNKSKDSTKKTQQPKLKGTSPIKSDTRSRSTVILDVKGSFKSNGNKINVQSTVGTRDLKSSKSGPNDRSSFTTSDRKSREKSTSDVDGKFSKEKQRAGDSEKRQSDSSNIKNKYRPSYTLPKNDITNKISSHTSLKAQRSILVPPGQKKMTNWKSLTLVYKNCFCDFDNCDCIKKEIVSRDHLNVDTADDIPKPPPDITNKPRRDSLELIKEKMSKSKLELSHRQSEADKPQNDENTQFKSIYEDTTNDTRAIYRDISDVLTSQLFANHRQTHSILQQGQSKKIKRVVSLALKNCACDEDDCDCVVMEVLSRRPSPTTLIADDVIPEPPKLPVGRTLSKVDSVELLKVRLSRGDVRSSSAGENLKNSPSESSTATEVHQTIAVNVGRGAETGTKSSKSEEPRRSLRASDKKVSIIVEKCQCVGNECGTCHMSVCECVKVAHVGSHRNTETKDYNKMITDTDPAVTVIMPIKSCRDSGMSLDSEPFFYDD